MGENEDSRATDSSGFEFFFFHVFSWTVSLPLAWFHFQAKTRLKSLIFCQVNKPVIRVNSSPSNNYWILRL